MFWLATGAGPVQNQVRAKRRGKNDDAVVKFATQIKTFSRDISRAIGKFRAPGGYVSPDPAGNLILNY